MVGCEPREVDAWLLRGVKTAAGEDIRVAHSALVDWRPLLSSAALTVLGVAGGAAAELGAMGPSPQGTMPGESSDGDLSCKEGSEMGTARKVVGRATPVWQGVAQLGC